MSGANELTLESRVKTHDGHLETFSHLSRSTQTPMRFSVFVPPQATSATGPQLSLFWLSGLTCSEENFAMKAGAFGHAAAANMLIIIPDTSPRGAGVAGEDDSWDFGTGAGFYVNATEAPWATHYNMYDYIVDELPGLVQDRYPLADKSGICGHSMGGHGAMVIGLRNPQRFASISAFAPICAPSVCPWGEKAFSRYLGQDQEKWRLYDTTALVQDGKVRTPLLIDQGGDDGFLQEQLKPELLQEACHRQDHPLEYRLHQGYDHSYFFISTFIGEHISYHAQRLGA